MVGNPLLPEHNQRRLKIFRKIALIVLLIVGFVIFLEAASSLVLQRFVNPARLERFDHIYVNSVSDIGLIPHPFLKYVQPAYIGEKERYLQHVIRDQSHNDTSTIYIVAIGGSTTKSGYPNYTLDFLNEKLRGINSTLQVVMFNFGVDGWSSFQGIQNYFYLLKYLHPDFIIIHENHNEGKIENFFTANAVEYYPDISPFEHRLVKTSRFYTLLKFTYLLTYNSLSYGREIRDYTFVDDKEPLPMTARISAYINERDPGAFMPLFFLRDYVGETFPSGELSREFILTESYESLVRYARADDAEVILMTQYHNLSKAAEGKYNNVTEKKLESKELNDIIRGIAEKDRIPFVDLETEMVPYDSFLRDEVHFINEGLRIVGEFAGAKVWEVMRAKYNLTESPASG